MMSKNHEYSDLTEIIIHCFYKVYNKLGYGFLEKVYEKALFIEIEKSNLRCQCQCPIEVFYDGQKIGFYIADMIVNNVVLIEIKALSGICIEHEAQLVNYLRATEIEVGLLLNFGKSPSIKRKVLSAAFK